MKITLAMAMTLSIALFGVLGVSHADSDGLEFNRLQCYRLNMQERLEASAYMYNELVGGQLCEFDVTTAELCVPADQFAYFDDEPVPADVPGSFMCYTVRCERYNVPPIREVEVIDQFGTHSGRLRIPAKRVCTPVR